MAERPRGGLVLVDKPVGPSSFAVVKRLRDRGRQRDVELCDQVAQDLTGRRRVRDDEVDVPEGRVVVVVVDVDHEPRRVEERVRLRPEAALVRAVDGDDNAVADVFRQVAPEALERHEPVLARERRRAREEHHGVLAELLERERRRDERAERVAVRVLVGRDEEAVVGADRLSDLPHFLLLDLVHPGKGCR